MNISNTLSDLIKTSRIEISRKYISKIPIDYQIRLVDCTLDKTKCSHIHGSLLKRRPKVSNIESIEMLDRLPELVVVEKAIKLIDAHGRGQSMICFQGYFVDKFTFADLCLLREIIMLRTVILKQIGPEINILENKYLVPEGLDHIDQEDLLKFTEELWSSR